MDFSRPSELIFISGLIALVPLLISLTTSYVKVSVVLGILKNGLGTQQFPGPIVTMALSLSITCYVMSPVMSESLEAFNEIPKLSKLDLFNINDLQKISPVVRPWKNFMLKFAGKKELRLFLGQEETSKKIEFDQKNISEISLKAIAPAFLITELKKAFSIAFIVLIPFLVIDLICANVLVGMGMFMVSPVLISLPIKLLVFVMSDAWILLVKSLINSYQVV